MSGYIGTTPVPQSTQSRQSFTATASQTTFNTSGYTAGFVDVYLNGVKLVDGTDFTATNGSDVVLTVGASASDVVDVVMFGTFEIANTSLTDATINDTLTLKNATEEDTDGGRESTIIFKGEQSGGEISTLAEIEASHDGASDDEKGDLIFRTNDGSDGTSPTERVRIDSNGSILTATLGTDNVHLGEGAGASIASGGNQNVLIGKDAGTAITTGDDNTAVGYTAGDAVTTGTRHTLMGYASGSSLIDSDRNVAYGYGSLQTDTKGTKSTAIGYSALNTQNFSSATDSHNTAVGYTAGESITTGTNNTIVGSTAGDAMTTCASNTAVGQGALGANQTANSNTAVGKGAGASTTVAAGTYVGTQAGENTNSVSNTFIGCSAGELITSGEKNTILGRYNGNEDSLDLRSDSQSVVLSNGDGTVMAYFRSNREMLMGTGQFNGATNAASGNFLRVNDRSQFNVSGGAALAANRLSNDGGVFEIRQDGATEGSISVSGSTVSYNGGHLARWAQLTDGSKDTSIVKGTVMTNLDQMSVWPNRDIDGNVTEGNEENEQLNCMAVSSVEGDVNVAGVFVNWDDDDDLVNDMNVAMTGDMVIRIAQGTSVARGDLLMSAGDGTAKPQGDDIVRSKTIAKVTSTNVSHTYDDGSYLVPCVLMAC